VLNYLSNALKFTEKRGKITVLLQYVQPMSRRERALGLSSVDDRAKAKLNEILDNFYGDDYLADSDSDEELLVEDFSDDSTQKATELSEEEKLTLEQKLQFREKQRVVLESMLTKEA